MEHRQVVRRQPAAAATDAVLQIGLLADLDGAQPTGLDHRQQLGGARRLLRRELRRQLQQHITEREVEIRRVRPVRHLGFGQLHGLLQAGQFLQGEQPPQHQVVAPTGTRWAARPGPRVVRFSGFKLALDLMVLAQLIVPVAVLRRCGQRLRQQAPDAPGLGHALRRLIAVVQHLQIESAAPQVGRRLLVNSTGILNAPWQHPRQPAGRLLLAAAPVVNLADHGDQADKLWRLLAQRVQDGRCAIDPFVGIQHQAPGRVGQGQRGISRGGEVIHPIELPDARTAAKRQGHRVVGRAGVEHPHFIDPSPGAVQAALDATRFVAGNQHQGNAVH